MLAMLSVERRREVAAPSLERLPDVTDGGQSRTGVFCERVQEVEVREVAHPCTGEQGDPVRSRERKSSGDLSKDNVHESQKFACVLLSKEERREQCFEIAGSSVHTLSRTWRPGAVRLPDCGEH